MALFIMPNEVKNTPGENKQKGKLLYVVNVTYTENRIVFLSKAFLVLLPAAIITFNKPKKRTIRHEEKSERYRVFVFKIYRTI